MPDMPPTFVIPNADPWPLRTRGFPLGNQVRLVSSKRVRAPRDPSCLSSLTVVSFFIYNAFWPHVLPLDSKTAIFSRFILNMS